MSCALKKNWDKNNKHWQYMYIHSSFYSCCSEMGNHNKLMLEKQAMNWVFAYVVSSLWRSTWTSDRPEAASLTASCYRWHSSCCNNFIHVVICFKILRSWYFVQCTLECRDLNILHIHFTYHCIVHADGDNYYLSVCRGTLKIQDWKIQDWKMRHQEKYGTL